MMIEMLGMRLATFVDIAKELETTSNQIYMWYQRRKHNGFPEPVLHRSAGNGVHDAPWFDIDEVLDWRAAYTPTRGRPRRNQ